MYFGVMLSDSQARMMFVVLLNLLPVQRLFAGLGMHCLRGLSCASSKNDRLIHEEDTEVRSADCIVILSG